MDEKLKKRMRSHLSWCRGRRGTDEFFRLAV